jgi:hypothetical protein
MQYIRNGVVKGVATSSLPERIILRFLHTLLQDSLAEKHAATQRRVKFFRDLKELAEEGKIAIVSSGMDCDGVEYSGDWTIVDATKEAVEKEVESINKWADGPIYNLGLMKPSDARQINRTSRDRTMEAFEDGHPWSI